MQLRFGRPLAYARHRSDVGVGVTLHLIEHEDFSSSIRKLLDRRFQIQAYSWLSPPGRHTIQNRVLRYLLLSPTPEGLSSRENEVDCQPVEPGPESGIATERPELRPGPDEYFLGQVLRPFSAGHPQGKGIHPAKVAPVEALEGVGTPPGGQGDVAAFLFRTQRQNGFDDLISQGFLST